VRTKVRAALTALAKIGPQEHEGETDFAKRCGLQLVEITRLRDHKDFVKHVAFVPKLLGRKARYVWFADPKIVPAKFRYTPEKDSE
jgi:hypothetical protein